MREAQGREWASGVGGDGGNRTSRFVIPQPPQFAPKFQGRPANHARKTLKPPPLRGPLCQPPHPTPTSCLILLDIHYRL